MWQLWTSVRQKAARPFTTRTLPFNLGCHLALSRNRPRLTRGNDSLFSRKITHLLRIGTIDIALISWAERIGIEGLAIANYTQIVGNRRQFGLEFTASSKVVQLSGARRL